MNSNETHFCTVCHSTMKPKKKYKGSFATEIVVWLVCLLLAPFTFGISLLIAIFFSASRQFSKSLVCSVCDSLNIVPKGSPAARSHLDKTNLSTN